jgi:outer membrane lipoprotein carrier protein
MAPSAQRALLCRILLTAMLFSVPAVTMLSVAEPPNTPESLAVRRMEQRYRSAKTLQATFLERYTENGHIVRSEAGTVYFRRPGKMRWEYESPEKNLFLVDGKTAWFYVPADRTVTRVPARESGDFRTPLALLAGEMKVSRVCARIEAAPHEKPEAPGDIVISCILRGDPQAGKTTPEESANSESSHDAILFEIAPDSGDLVRLRIRDEGGVQVEFHFAAWHTDPPFPEQFFRFTVPPGVVIVNGELAPGQAPEQP